ncbi:MAG: polysaccharide deacetylase family protein [Calditrichaeota bacterium]|nr:polysaccharide deacetylase family protein [Calditrichota bacterium]
MTGVKNSVQRPLAAVSLDLDDKWSYMRTRGDARWKELPSYLAVAVPRMLDFLRAKGLRITFFIVGVDAARPQNGDLLRMIVQDGHELGNHSYHHEPWLPRHPRATIAEEVLRTHEELLRVTGARPEGFRGPGFGWSATLIEVLAEAGYSYDASSLPTVVAPLARLYFLSKSTLEKEERQLREGLFGSFRDGLRPVGAHYLGLDGHRLLLEIPVTTIPGLRTPFHLSYLMYLAQRSRPLMRTYLELALSLCRATATGPSFLLHPLDFLDKGDAPELAFFPAMNLPWQDKIEVAGEALDRLAARFELLPMGAFACFVARSGVLPTVRMANGGHEQ